MSVCERPGLCVFLLVSLCLYVLLCTSICVCVCIYCSHCVHRSAVCSCVCVCVCVRAASVAVFDIYTMIDVQPERSAPPPHPSSSFSGVSRSRL